MGEKTYTLKLTALQAYYLRECFEASFTDAGSMGETERQLSIMLDRLQQQVFRDKKRRADHAA